MMRLYGPTGNNRYPVSWSTGHIITFLNYEQNDWARLLPIAEFAYSNAKNVTTGHIVFELNCAFYPRVSYKEDVDSHSKSKAEDKLVDELRDLMSACKENLPHA